MVAQPQLDNILSVVLGGGRGSRLYPLTRMRSKPAVPIAGKYRLIDIPISNSINSGIYHIAVLTQFNSVSLHRHLTQTYHFDVFHTGWVQVWAAEQTMASADWYQGTADAVRKQLSEIRSAGKPYVLILAGDHLYRMDYAAMARFHWDNSADITIAVQPVAAGDSGRFGLLKRNENHRITDFAEKPTDPKVLERMTSRDDPERPFLGSMGIYMFNTEVLFELLEGAPHDDFGGQVIPNAIGDRAVFGFDFDDFWEDIGTIRSFYDTNLALAMPTPNFSFYDPERPIYSNPTVLPSSTLINCHLENVLLTDGCRLQNAEIRNTVVGLRSYLGNNVRISDSILMGSDYFQTGSRTFDNPPIGIGDNSTIQGAIIDKNVRIGENVTIHSFPRSVDMDAEDWVVRDGIVVVAKNSFIPAGTYIGPM
jgi:glucose-1-phosphate adenylyltransferase